MQGWRTAAGPITYDSLYNGEAYDSRVAAALDGWSLPAFNDAAWVPAAIANSVANNASLSSQSFEPIRHIATFQPLSVTTPANDTQVFDFGQNLAGVVHLKHITCAAGQAVTIRHAELLTHPPYGPVDGSIYVGNLRSAKATDVYTCRGDPAGESYIPTFTQHGFRYAEVTGLGYPLAYDAIESVELHSDVVQHSSIAFSQPLLNRIQHAVVWGQKSNLMSVPTDCNQRDERRGSAPPTDAPARHDRFFAPHGPYHNSPSHCFCFSIACVCVYECWQCTFISL